MSQKKILVPTDFTEVAENAIAHAGNMANAIGGSVLLLHIIENEDERANAEQKLIEEIDIVKKINAGIVVDTLVRTGNIFEDIVGVAKENHVHLIFMGTHGMKGLQFLTGSNALKVVTGSNVPFIIVQDREYNLGGYDDIIVPITLDKKTKQKLVNVANMARYFNSKVHIIAADESDEFLRNQVRRNLKYAENYFEEIGVDYSTTLCKKSGSKYAKAILELAKEKNADLISVMNMSDTGIFSLLGSQIEQDLITNDLKIPVMLVNPKNTSVNTSVFSS